MASYSVLTLSQSLTSHSDISFSCTAYHIPMFHHRLNHRALIPAWLDWHNFQIFSDRQSSLGHRPLNSHRYCSRAKHRIFTPKKLLLWTQRYQSRAFNHYLSALLINVACFWRFKLQISVKLCDIVYFDRVCLLGSCSLIEITLLGCWWSSIGYFRLLVPMRLVNIIFERWFSLLPNWHVIEHLCSNLGSNRLRLIKSDVFIVLAQLRTSS